MVDTAIARSTLVHEDERVIAAAIAAGDRAAFEHLMRRYNRRLYRLARATLRDRTEAEDALQDAYICAYRSIGQFRGDASLATWLSRLVLNECLARMRRTARRQNVRFEGHRAERRLDLGGAEAGHLFLCLRISPYNEGNGHGAMRRKG